MRKGNFKICFKKIIKYFLKVQKGNVSIKIWDIGGQPRFRGMWERYCRGVNVIVYMVDAANRDNLDAAASELHQLMEKPQLQV